MTKQKFWTQLLLFIAVLLAVLATREYITDQLFVKGNESYVTHTLVKIIANVILIVISVFFIKKNRLYTIAGMKDTKLRNWYLLLFPILFLVALNVILLDNVKLHILLPNLAILAVYCISIGFAEELSIRGFLQSHLIQYFNNTKKNSIISVFLASLFFGVLHLFSFDKGFFGEISQVLFATFIGVMFGVLLVVTKRIYPLILVHILVDFVAKLDTAGLPVKAKIHSVMSLENAFVITVLTLPCLLYAILLMNRYSLVSNSN